MQNVGHCWRKMMLINSTAENEAFLFIHSTLHVIQWRILACFDYILLFYFTRWDKPKTVLSYALYIVLLSK